MKPMSKSRPRRFAVGAATVALMLPLAAGQVGADPAHAAVSCDTSSVVGPAGGATADETTVTVSGVATRVCELKFEYVGVPGTDDSSVYAWNVPSDITTIDFILIAGGGGGASGSRDDSVAGGGGGGGKGTDDAYSNSAMGTLTIEVGAGGLGGQLDDSPGLDGHGSRLVVPTLTYSQDPGEGGGSGSGRNSPGKGGESASGGGLWDDTIPSGWTAGGGGGGYKGSGVKASLPNGGNGGVGYDYPVGGLFGGQVFPYSGGGGGGGVPFGSPGVGGGGLNWWLHVTMGCGDGRPGCRVRG